MASVSVTPEPLDQVERARVESALSRFNVDGIDYRLIGASGSAKNGKYYAVDSRYERPLAARFSDWPQAAVTYFGILVSPCQVRMQVPQGRVTVVPDHELGTNDCRGWLRKSLFDKLALPARSLLPVPSCVFANTGERQLQGHVRRCRRCLRIPTLSCRFRRSNPNTRVPAKLVAWLTGEARTFAGEMILGIRECSRLLNFESSYTVIQHAPEDSFAHEIKPHALAQSSKLKELLESRDFTDCFDFSGSQKLSARWSTRLRPKATTSTSVERSVLEGILKADPTGFLVQHPWVNNQLQRVLARWAFKVCTAGGFEMPAFALADDGYLFLHGGKVYSGSDWMPLDRSINALATKRGLVVRYPVRMKEDLASVHEDPHIRTATTARARTRSSGMFGNGRPGPSDRDSADWSSRARSLCTRKPRPRMGETTISTLSA